MAKSLTGVVSSSKGDKSIVVTITVQKTHPLYKKQYKMSKRFSAHDEKNEAKVGDRVIISETRPLSKTKHHTLTKIVEKAAISAEYTVEAITKAEQPGAVEHPVVKDEQEAKK